MDTAIDTDLVVTAIDNGHNVGHRRQWTEYLWSQETMDTMLVVTGDD